MSGAAMMEAAGAAPSSPSAGSFDSGLCLELLRVIDFQGVPDYAEISGSGHGGQQQEAESAPTISSSFCSRATRHR